MTSNTATRPVRAFTNPEMLAAFIAARWDVTDAVRDRIAGQLADLTVPEVLDRLVCQIVEDYDDDGGDGIYGGAWVEYGAMRKDADGYVRAELLDVATLPDGKTGSVAA